MEIPIKLGLLPLKEVDRESGDFKAMRIVWDGLGHLLNNRTEEVSTRHFVRATEMLGELLLRLPSNPAGLSPELAQRLCWRILLEENTPPEHKAAIIKDLLPATIRRSTGRERERLVENFENCVERELGNIPALGEIFKASLHAIETLALSKVVRVDALLAACFRACEMESNKWCKAWSTAALAVYRKENLDILSKETTEGIARRIGRTLHKPGGKHLHKVLLTEPLKPYEALANAAAAGNGETGDIEEND